ncbi:hypothetical protein C8F01DRAFT_1377723 [Mycena amicta]|nr:hypothetical protein C8F01DRAFT_1377723 [Mycena amicta]
MSIISLNTTTSSASTSTSSFSSSESSDRPRLAPVSTTGHWAHLPPPPGYIPDREHKTSYNARQRLAHLEADEFCTNVRITAVLCLGCSNDIALDARFVMYPCLWLKHRRTCVGVQMLAMGFDPKGNLGREEALALVRLRMGKQRYQRKATKKQDLKQTTVSRPEDTADAARFKAFTVPRRRPTSSPRKIVPHFTHTQPEPAPRGQACPLSKILC